MRALSSRLVVALVVAGCAGERPPGIGTFDAGPPGPGPDDLGAPSPDAALPSRAASTYPTYDLTVVLPFDGPERVFEMEAEPRATKLDVHLNVDTTGSFNGEIANLKLALGANVIPALRARVGDLAMGVSRFGDFPVSPFGRNTDSPYNLLTPVTTDLGRVLSAVNALDRPLQNGGDPAEAWGEALFQVATGAGLSGLTLGNIPRYTPPSADLVGGVGFRAGAARVVINVTDAPSHEPSDYGASVPGTHSVEEAGAALHLLGARMIGIASGDGSRAQMEALAVRTGAVAPATGGRCSTGVGGTMRPAVNGSCPLVFDIADDGTGLGAVLVDGILRFLDSLAFARVDGRATADPNGFVRAIEAVGARVPDGGTAPQRADLAPAAMPDGVLDTFLEVPTRTRLTFRVHLRNVTQRETEYPQLYFVRVTLVGDGVTVDERVVRVIIPEGPKPDGGDGGADAVVPADAPAATDLGTDLGTDAGADVGTDLGTDLGTDAGADDGGVVEVATDAGADDAAD